MEHVMDVIIRLVKEGKEEEARQKFEDWSKPVFKESFDASHKLSQIYKILRPQETNEQC